MEKNEDVADWDEEELDPSESCLDCKVSSSTLGYWEPAGEATKRPAIVFQTNDSTLTFFRSESSARSSEFWILDFFLLGSL